MAVSALSAPASAAGAAPGQGVGHDSSAAGSANPSSASSSHTTSSPVASNAGHPCLIEAAFPLFRPLLAATQEYARFSGCRFRSSSFDGIECSHDEVPVVGAQRGRDPGPLLGAKILAAPAVRDFGERLRSNEAALGEELGRALEVVAAESVRNVLVSKCKELCMFPPSPSPAGVDADDRDYWDALAPLPVIAQRLYNDELRRRWGTGGGGCHAQRLRLTATFVMEFAEQSGVPVSPVAEAHQAKLEEFAQRVEEWLGHEPASPTGESPCDAPAAARPEKPEEGSDLK